MVLQKLVQILQRVLLLKGLPDPHGALLLLIHSFGEPLEDVFLLLIVYIRKEQHLLPVLVFLPLLEVFLGFEHDRLRSLDLLVELWQDFQALILRLDLEVREFDFLLHSILVLTDVLLVS